MVEFVYVMHCGIYKTEKKMFMALCIQSIVSIFNFFFVEARSTAIRPDGRVKLILIVCVRVVWVEV